MKKWKPHLLKLLTGVSFGAAAFVSQKESIKIYAYYWPLYIGLLLVAALPTIIHLRGQLLATKRKASLDWPIHEMVGEPIVHINWDGRWDVVENWALGCGLGLNAGSAEKRRFFKTRNAGWKVPIVYGFLAADGTLDIWCWLDDLSRARRVDLTNLRLNPKRIRRELNQLLGMLGNDSRV